MIADAPRSQLNLFREAHLRRVEENLNITFDYPTELCDLALAQKVYDKAGLPIFVVGYNARERFLKVYFAKLPDYPHLKAIDTIKMANQALARKKHLFPGVDRVRCHPLNTDMMGAYLLFDEQVD